MKKLLLVLCIFYFHTSVKAQTTHFKKAFQYSNSASGTNFIPAMNGGYYIYGSTYSGSGITTIFTMYIMREDADGKPVWWKHFSSKNGLIISSLLQEDDGSLLGAFSSDSGNAFAPITTTSILRLDSNGNVLSQHAYKMQIAEPGTTWYDSVSVPTKLIKNRFSNDYSLLLSINVESSIGVARISADGELTSMIGVYHSRLDFPVDLQQTADSGFIIAATNRNFGVYPWLCKLNSSGQIQWSIRPYYNETYIYNSNNNVSQLSDGSYLWSAYHYIDTITSRFGYSHDLMKIDNAGNVLWSKKLVAQNSDSISIYGMYKINEETFAFNAGKQIHGTNQYQPLLVVIDTSGNVLSGKLFDFGNSATFSSLYFNNNSELAFCGSYPGANSEILFGVTDINTPEECFESNYDLGFINTTVVTAPVAHLDSFDFAEVPGSDLVVSSGGTDSLLCQTQFSVHNHLEESIQAQLYPNPVSDELTVGMPNGTIASHIELTDALGRVVWGMKPKSSTFKVNLKSLSLGIYMIRIETENERTIHYKVVKE